MSNIDPELREVFTYIFTWHALSDACPKCQQLNGHEYLDQDLFGQTVWDPIWGDVWDLDANWSMAHPNCRCQLEVRVDVHLEKIPELNVFMQQITRYGKPVTIYRVAATGRFAKAP